MEERLTHRDPLPHTREPIALLVRRTRKKKAKRSRGRFSVQSPQDAHALARPVQTQRRF